MKNAEYLANTLGSRSTECKSPSSDTFRRRWWPKKAATSGWTWWVAAGVCRPEKRWPSAQCCSGWSPFRRNWCVGASTGNWRRTSTRERTRRGHRPQRSRRRPATRRWRTTSCWWGTKRRCRIEHRRRWWLRTDFVQEVAPIWPSSRAWPDTWRLRRVPPRPSRRWRRPRRPRLQVESTTSEWLYRGCPIRTPISLRTSRPWNRPEFEWLHNHKRTTPR